MLDRRGDARAHELEQVQVLASEPARPRRPDVHDADRTTGDEERDAHQRRDPIAQHAARALDARKVVHDQRRTADRDAPGDAFVARDDEPLAELLVEPERSAHAERAAVLVDEEHGDRVDGERLAHARHHGLEEVVEVEV